MACRSSCSCGLDLHKAHVLFGHGFGDRFGIDEVVLVRLAVRLHKLRRNESHLVSLFSQCGAHKVRSRAGFQADQRGRQVGSVGQQLRARELLAKQNLAALSQCNQVKGGLAQIDADGCDVHAMILLDINCRAVILLGGGPSH